MRFFRIHITSAITLFLICAFFIILIKHFNTISYPFPNEFREGHMLSSTSLLLKGQNPYSLENYPSYYNSYGIIYPLINCLPASIFGLSLQIHRLVNGVFILSVLLLLFFSYKKKILKDLMLYSVLLLLLYISLIHSTNGVVRPDGLGTLLFTLSVLIPIKCNFKSKSLLLSIFISILAFYTKPYFLLGWLLVSAYLLFFSNLKKFILYNFIFAIVLFSSTFIINSLFPLYFYETIFAYSSSFGSLLYSIKQTIAFYIFIAPISFIVLLSFIQSIKLHSPFKFNLIYLKTNPSILFVLLASIVLIYPLGVNDGTFITYHQQLLSPLIFLSFVNYKNNLFINIFKKPFVSFLACTLLIIPLYLQRPYFNGDTKKWQEIEQFISTKDNVLNSPIIAPLLIKQNKTIYDNGVSSFVCFFKSQKCTELLLKKDSILLNKKIMFFKNIENQIKSKKFDAIILNPLTDRWLMKFVDPNYYYLSRKENLFIPHQNVNWEVLIYEPK